MGLSATFVTAAPDAVREMGALFVRSRHPGL